MSEFTSATAVPKHILEAIRRIRAPTNSNSPSQSLDRVQLRRTQARFGDALGVPRYCREGERGGIEGRGQGDGEHWGPSMGTGMNRRVVLLGLMGSGKSSVGRLVAEGLGLRLVDGDKVLSACLGGRTAADAAAQLGMDHMQEFEASIASR
jgi:hypothetical protein